MTGNHKRGGGYKRPKLETRVKAGKILIKEREKLGFSAQKVAKDILNISYIAYLGYEQGRIWPREINQEKICGLYGFLREELFPLAYNLPEIIPLSRVEESILAYNMQEEVERKIIVDELLNSLDSKEKTIIELHYSLNGDGPYSLVDIGRLKFGVNRENIRQHKEKALEKLRKGL